MTLDGLELVEDIAPKVGASQATLRKWCRRGTFPHTRLPGTRRLLFNPEHVTAYVNGAQLETTLLPNGGRIVAPVEKPRKGRP
jgi:predicted site-specific integrase-resolvase